MQKSKNAFTMIELVFVIVILGILAAVAVPRLAATRTDAQIAKGRTGIASLRSAIMTERQSRLIKGDNKYIEAGVGVGQLDETSLFNGVLTYGITDSATAGHWTSIAHPDVNNSTYDYNVAGTTIRFAYSRANGIFTCDKTAGTAKQKEYCASLID